MQNAVIVGAVRTAVGRKGGKLAGDRPDDLLADTLKALVERVKIDPREVEDVVIGCVDQVGEQGFNIARNAALIAGFPLDVCGTTLDRMCGSGQQAANFAAMGVMAGQYECVIAGGVENMTRVPMGSNGMGPGDGPLSPRLQALYNIIPQGLSAEMIAEQWGLKREELDEFSAGSHEKAGRAIAEGRFKREIAPLTLADGSVFDTDEGVRVPVNREKMAALAPSFKPDGVVTAANSSQISDGAAALLIMSEARAKAARAHAARAHRGDGAGRRGSDHHADRADPRHPACAREGGDEARADRSVRDQRGVRLGRAGVGARAAPRHGAGQRERRRDRARPSARLLRRQAHDHAAARARALEEAVRAPDHVHRLRAGDRHDHRALVVPSAGPRAAPSAFCTALCSSAGRTGLKSSEETPRPRERAWSSSCRPQPVMKISGTCGSRARSRSASVPAAHLRHARCW